MPSSISWTDAYGSATLVNGKITPGDRMNDWVVRRKPIGPAVTGLGTGDIHRFEFRKDQTVSFHIDAIPEAQMETMCRLEYHLLSGGVVTLVGDRAMSEQFATCKLAPDTEPDISQSDPQTREYSFSCVLRGSTIGVIGSCTQPNTTTTAATSGLSATRVRGDDFSAWGLEDYDAFKDDTVDNPNYSDGVGTLPYDAYDATPDKPGFFLEYFNDLSSLDPEYTPPPEQPNRNRISQLAVNGGHRTLKAVKTSDDLAELQNGYEIQALRAPAGLSYTSFWQRLAFQYSANYPMGAALDGSKGVWLIELGTVTIATGTLSYPSSMLTVSHQAPSKPSFEVPLGFNTEILTTGTPLEIVVYVGTVWDEEGTPSTTMYRVAVWIYPAFGTPVKFYDVIKPRGVTAPTVATVTYFNPKALPDYVPEGDSAICYECIEWEFEGGGFGLDPYGVESAEWTLDRVANNVFAERQTISGDSGTVTQSNLFCDEETGEPRTSSGGTSGNIRKTLWYEWTAPSSGTAVFDTLSTALPVDDTLLGVYTGSAVDALSEVAFNDDSGAGSLSSVSFAAVSGTVYKIQVGTYVGEAVGPITLNWSLA